MTRNSFAVVTIITVVAATALSGYQSKDAALDPVRVAAAAPTALPSRTPSFACSTFVSLPARWSPVTAIRMA